MLLPAPMVGHHAVLPSTGGDLLERHRSCRATGASKPPNATGSSQAVDPRTAKGEHELLREATVALDLVGPLGDQAERFLDRLMNVPHAARHLHVFGHRTSLAGSDPVGRSI